MSKHIVADVDFIECPYCSKKSKVLHWKHLKTHGKKLDDVLIEFPGIPTITKSDYEKKCNTAKMGSKASKETCHDKKIIYCVYKSDDNCPGEPHEVPNNFPSTIMCDNCRKLGKPEVEGRRKDHANEARAKTISNKYGSEYTNIQQVPEVNQKMITTQRKRYNGVGFESKELAKKSRSKTEELYGDENIMRTEEGQKRFIRYFQNKFGKNITNPQHILEISETLSKTKKEFFKNNHQHSKGKTYEEIYGSKKAKELKEQRRISGADGYEKAPKVSKPQLELFELVKELFPFAKLDYRTYSYFLDVAIIEHKICIEYDGSYWHDKNHDAVRDRILSGFGWKIIRFVDYVPTKEELTDKIKEVL